MRPGHAQSMADSELKVTSKGLDCDLFNYEIITRSTISLVGLMTGHKYLRGGAMSFVH